MFSLYTHLSERPVISLIPGQTDGPSATVHQQWQTPPHILHLPKKAIDSMSKVRMDDKVLHFNRKTECGSSAQSCQRNVIQTVNGTQVEMWKREIPHCITALLSKLYYLGHSLLYGCQSYHTNNWNGPSLALPAPTHKHSHTEKAKCCEYNQHTNKQ